MRIIGLILLAIALGGVPGVAQATTGTCTISQMAQTNPYPLGFDFGMPVAVGVAMPVEFDEAAGTFSMSRDAWRAQFPGLGAQFDTIGGVHGYLQMDPGVTVGTIDAGGNISLPHFLVRNSTDFVSPPPDLPVEMLDVATGLLGRSLGGQFRTTTGVALDFQTGAVTLNGPGFIYDAPGSSGTNLAGFKMTCTLSPIPSQAALPPAPTFTKISGKAVIGGAVTEGDKGDQLTLKGSIATGAAFALETATDLLLEVSAAGAPQAFLSVRIAALAKKGKKFVAVRDDECKLKKGASEGTCARDASVVCTSHRDCASNDVVEVLVGRKQSGTDRSEVGGTITFTPKKKATLLAAKLQGLDLAALTGDVNLQLWVLGRGTTGSATASGASRRKIK